MQQHLHHCRHYSISTTHFQTASYLQRMQSPFNHDAILTYKQTPDFKCARNSNSTTVSWRQWPEESNALAKLSATAPPVHRPIFSALFIGHFHQNRTYMMTQLVDQYFTQLRVQLKHSLPQRDDYGKFLIASVLQVIL